VIVQVGSKEVIYFKDLQHTVGMTKPNTNLKLRLFRDGEYKNLYVKVGELPSLNQAEPETREPEVPDYPLGLQLENLNDEDSNEENLGVRVIQVTSNSPAFGEIFRGDIITKIKSSNITYDISNVEDFVDALDSFAVGDKIAIFGTREGSNFFVAVTVE
jgi:serine protease Do